MSLLDLLEPYKNPSTVPAAAVPGHFDQAAQQASPQDIGQGIAAAFRSDATPAFGQTIGQLFGQSDPQQRAGLLNELVRSVGPGALAGVAGGLLGPIFGNAGAGAPPPTITPDQASQVSATDVTAMAKQAQSQDDSIVDRIGGFYAQHPTLVKTMGAAALAIVLGHVRDQQ